MKKVFVLFLCLILVCTGAAANEWAVGEEDAWDEIASSEEDLDFGSSEEGIFREFPSGGEESAGEDDGFIARPAESDVLVGVSQDEAVNWIRNQNGAYYNLDGAYGAQCSDLVSAYMNWLITGDAYSGTYSVYNANQYPAVAGWNPDWWEVIENYREFIPNPGDIFVTTGSDPSVGHTGIVIYSGDINTATVIDQNSINPNYVDGHSAYLHDIVWSGAYNPLYFIRFKGFTASAPAGPRGSEMSSGYDRVLPDGAYIIGNAADRNYFLDIIGGDAPAANGTNVNLWHADSINMIGDHDVWSIKYTDGFYRISQYGQNVSLDVADGDTLNGKNVQAYENDGTSAQKWAISSSGSTGYRIQAKCSGYSLDLAGGTLEDGNNVRQWENNDSDAQRWVFIPYKPEHTLPDGRYILVSAVDPSLELDIEGNTANVENGTNVQVCYDNTVEFNEQSLSKYNAFDVKYYGDGYYQLTQAVSGKAIDVSSWTWSNGQNLQMWDNTGVIAQLWAITPNGEGYVLRAKCSGYAMDITGEQDYADGSNVHQWQYHGGKNQTWKFVPAEYTVNYNANGGTGAPSVQRKFYKGMLRLSSSKPSRQGYIFKGWADSSAAASAAYQPGGVYNKDANVTLYAVWEKIPEPTITPTPADTPVPATPTPTNTPIPATPTPTNTPKPATPTPTSTPVPENGTISLNQKSATLYVNSSQDYIELVPTVSGFANYDKDDVEFISSNPSVCAVDDFGYVEALKKGSATITALLDVDGREFKATCKIKVRKTAVNVSPTKVTVKKRKKIALIVNTTPADPVTFKSSNKKIATVSSAGVVKGKKKGTTTITIKCNGVSKKVKVTVK